MKVLDAGGPAPLWVGVVELLDVVVLRIGAGGPGASGRCADGISETEVLDHRRGGTVLVRREGQELPRRRIGEHPVPDLLAGGEPSGHVRGQRDHTVVGRRRVVQAHQGQHRHDHVDAMAFTGHLDARRVEHGAGDQCIPDRCERHRRPRSGRVAVEVEGDRAAVLERVTLLRLDRPRTGVEAAGKTQDLVERSGDAQAGGAVVLWGALESDVAHIFRTRASPVSIEPCDEKPKALQESWCRNGGQIPRGYSLVHFSALKCRQLAHGSQESVEPFRGHISRRQATEDQRHLVHRDMSVTQQRRRSRGGGAQSDGDREIRFFAVVDEVGITPVHPEVRNCPQQMSACSRGLALHPHQAGRRCRVGRSGLEPASLEQGLLGKRRPGLHARSGRLHPVGTLDPLACAGRPGRPDGRRHGLARLMLQQRHDTHPSPETIEPAVARSAAPTTRRREPLTPFLLCVHFMVSSGYSQAIYRYRGNCG